MKPSPQKKTPPEKKSETRLFRAMGTEAYIEIVHTEESGSRARSSIARAIDICFEKVQIFSRFEPSSELSAMNRRLGVSRVASPDMLKVARHALRFYEESKGLFDPRILDILEHIGYRSDFTENPPSPAPSLATLLFPKKRAPLDRDLKISEETLRFRVRMDFSGIAKGYILDAMADSLAHDGWENFLVDAGGDIVARGRNREGTPWRIAVENVPEEHLLLGLSLHSIATSGITRRHWQSANGKRFHHLIDPRNPDRFDTDLLSVSVASKTAERADFLAKTLFLMGIEKGLRCAEKHHIPAVFVDAGYRVRTSGSVKTLLVEPSLLQPTKK